MIPKIETWLPSPFLLLLLATSTPLNAALDEQRNLSADSTNLQQVQRGQLVYRRFCSLCHGADLEGQPNWRKRKPDGKLPAPPHDETGHTWHHPDRMLFEIIKNGLVPPNAPPNYQSDMPAWKETLKDEDIWAVLAYIKSRWPEDTQKIQQEINLGGK